MVEKTGLAARLSAPAKGKAKLDRSYRGDAHSCTNAANELVADDRQGSRTITGDAGASREGPKNCRRRFRKCGRWNPHCELKSSSLQLIATR
jgi:hypothetical protein